MGSACSRGVLRRRALPSSLAGGHARNLPARGHGVAARSLRRMARRAWTSRARVRGLRHQHGALAPLGACRRPVARDITGDARPAFSPRHDVFPHLRERAHRSDSATARAVARAGPTRAAHGASAHRPRRDEAHRDRVALSRGLDRSARARCHRRERSRALGLGRASLRLVLSELLRVVGRGHRPRCAHRPRGGRELRRTLARARAGRLLASLARLARAVAA